MIRACAIKKNLAVLNNEVYCSPAHLKATSCKLQASCYPRIKSQRLDLTSSLAVIGMFSSRANNCFQKVRYCLTPHSLTRHNSPAVISLEPSATARFTFPRLPADSQLLFELQSAHTHRHTSTHTHTTKCNKCGHMSSYLSWPSRHCPTDKQHKR